MELRLVDPSVDLVISRYISMTGNPEVGNFKRVAQTVRPFSALPPLWSYKWCSFLGSSPALSLPCSAISTLSNFWKQGFKILLALLYQIKFGQG